MGPARRTRGTHNRSVKPYLARSGVLGRTRSPPRSLRRGNHRSGAPCPQGACEERSRPLRRCGRSESQPHRPPSLSPLADCRVCSRPSRPASATSRPTTTRHVGWPAELRNPSTAEGNDPSSPTPVRPIAPRTLPGESNGTTAPRCGSVWHHNWAAGCLRQGRSPPGTSDRHPVSSRFCYRECCLKGIVVRYPIDSPD